MKTKYTKVKIKKIRRNKNQPRKTFDEDKLIELAQSIKENGLIQPIVIQPVKKHYEIVAGERRYRACKMLGMKKIPAIIQDYSNQESDVVSVLENIQRENLNAYEEALGYKKLINKYGLSQRELAKRVGKTQSTIANKLRLLKVSESVQHAITNQLISERHARALLCLGKDEQDKALKAIIENNLSVRDSEEYIDTIKLSENNLRIKTQEKSYQELIKCLEKLEQKNSNVKHKIKKTKKGYSIKVIIKD